MRTPSTTTQIILQMPVLKSYLILFNYVYLPTYLWHFLCTIPHIYPILLHISYIHIIIIYIYHGVIHSKKNMMVYQYIQLYHNPYGIYDLWPMTMAFPMASEAVARWATASARWPCRRTNRGRRRWRPGATPSSPHCCGRRRGAVAGSQGPPGAPRWFLLNGMDMKYILYDIHMPISSHISVHIMIYEYLWHLWMMILIYIIDVNHKRIICG